MLPKKLSVFKAKWQIDADWVRRVCPNKDGQQETPLICLLEDVWCYFTTFTSSTCQLYRCSHVSAVSYVINNRPSSWKQSFFPQHPWASLAVGCFSVFKKKYLSVFSFLNSEKTDSDKGLCRCSDRTPRSHRGCRALLIRLEMLPLDKTPCVWSRHAAAVITLTVCLPHILLKLDYCRGTNIWASGFQTPGSAEAVWGIMIAALSSVTADYACF